MLSIRMRASMKVSRAKKEDRGGGRPRNLENGVEEIHISGAEGIYCYADRFKVIGEYAERALTHSRGKADRIVITIEKIKGRPKLIRSLPVTTLKCFSTAESERHVGRLLVSLGVSERAVGEALRVIRNESAMRGAALILAASGRRAEPDRTRGVRASRLGITPAAGKTFSRRLAKEGIDTETVKEAVILASKVASCKDVAAELCVSDDPDYTTGYVASRTFGYIRIPQMKKKGSRRGGRVFFLNEGADVASAVDFLERRAVIINNTGGCRGVRSIDEILDSLYR
jgi:6-carboxyhexanoate--CoA ligase